MVPKASLLVPVCVCLVLCAGFIKLGLWQVERLAWKNNLVAELAREFQIDAASRPLSMDDFKDLHVQDMRRGFFTGEIDFSHVLLQQGKIEKGHNIYPVVALFHEKAGSFVMPVVAGCQTDTDIAAITQLGLRPVKAVGLVHVPASSRFLPDNDLARGILWRLDGADVLPFFGEKNSSRLPWVMILENSVDLAPSLTACGVPHDLPNDHKAYAQFWFFMAFLTPVLFAVRFRKRYLQSA